MGGVDARLVVGAGFQLAKALVVAGLEILKGADERFDAVARGPRMDGNQAGAREGAGGGNGVHESNLQSISSGPCLMCAAQKPVFANYFACAERIFR